MKIKYLISVLIICIFVACQNNYAKNETMSGNQTWSISPIFEVPFKDNEGNDRVFPMKGVQNKLGINGALPFIVGGTEKTVWHFWGTPEQLQGKVTILGTNQIKGKTKTLYKADQLGGPNLGANASLPSGIKLDSEGLWKLDVYLDDQLFETIVVQAVTRETYKQGFR